MQGVRGLFRGEKGESYAVTFALVSVLFLLWGFCNGMLDTLDKHFQNTFHISKGISALVPCASFFGYAVMAIPAGFLSRRFGYKFGILTGLALVALGTLWFVPATHINTFPAFLLGLFIIGNGLTFLETAANPYTTVLGPAQSSAVRINLAQSGNAVGWMLGPAVAGFFVLSSTGEVNRSNANLYLPYMCVGMAVTVLFVIFWFARIPDIRAEEEDTASTQAHRPVKPLWQRWHLILAVMAQFLYVGAQSGIFNFFINYVTSSDTPPISAAWAAQLPHWMTAQAADGFHFTDNGAAKLLSIGGMMLFLIGRFAGSAILRFFSAHAVLATYAVVETVLMVLICLPLGWVSFVSLFLSFFFISIMFPTIFALGIRGLGEQTKFASSFLVMAILGGALLPLVMGHLADVYSMRIGFLMPLICFIFIAAYAFSWPALERRDAGHEVAD
jgi:FHS family L-fucose permease-like MFS transporter